MQRPSRPSRPALLAAVAAAALFLGTSLPAQADHAQADSGRVVAFDHRTGNEWWVEVVTSGQDAGSIASVDAMDTAGQWTPLAKKSWGAWAASFHIEPGNEVRFRATWSGGAQQASCWFTHPAGIERCPAASTSSTTSSASTTTTSSGTATTSPSPRLAFDHRGGNEWWVEALVSGGSPARVQAQDGSGPWTDLQLKSWGNWAASFRIEPGNLVRFRAEAGGAWQESCWFTHPGGRTPTGGETCASGSPTPPPPSSFATFHGVKGNPYWVEARVTADRPLAGVDASVDGGPWRALTLRSWGAWAASFFVADGSYVQLRAVAQDGSVATSGDHVWPSARAVTPWPQAGSFVAYDVHVAGNAPDGSYSLVTDARLRLQYDGVAWVGRCTGTQNETANGASTVRAFDEAVTGPPAFGPSDPQAGATIDPTLFGDPSYGSCRVDEDEAVVEGEGPQGTRLRDASGRTLTLAGWRAVEPSGNSVFEDVAYAWEGRHGLVLAWERSGRGGGFDGGLVDTDAPIR